MAVSCAWSTTIWSAGRIGLVPEGDPFYTHDTEGPNDMPAHIKAVLTQMNLSIPITGGRLALGTWQGIYIWEHRHAKSTRHVILHIAP